jgi:chlorobactene glucosyltransferase
MLLGIINSMSLNMSLFFVYVVLGSILLLWIYLFIISIKSFLKITSLKSTANKITATESNPLKSNTVLSKLRRLPSISKDYYHNTDITNQYSHHLPFVSVIVPARNEEKEIERCLASILKQNYPSFEVIAIDDSSSDSTFEIMKKVKEETPDVADKLTILSTADYEKKPDDWFGKTWVSEKAFERSRGEIILFTDSDTNYSSPYTILTSISYMMKENLDVLGGLPYLRLQDLLSKIVMPLWNLLSLLLSDAGKVNDPNRIDIAFLLGSFFLIKRDLFVKSGTYKVVKDAIQEDFDLAMVLKRNGCRLRLVKTDSLVSALWSRDSITLWQGIGRTIVPVVVRSLKKVLFGLFSIVYMAALPFIICFTIIFGIVAFGWNVSNELMFFSLVSCFTVFIGAYIKGLVQYKEKNPWYAAFSVFGAFYLAINYLINIVPLLTNRRKIVKWRGRTYEYKMPPTRQ